MSGHSKWAKIHRQKAVSDAKRGGVFTKLTNAITVAARIGGGNIEMNFRLKLAIDKAKAHNMPKENIERAIRRGTGEDLKWAMEQILYEGFGPGGAAFVVECFSDNRNRTSALLKHIFAEHGGNLSAPNAVLWQFDLKGAVGLQHLDEVLELELIDQGVIDIQKEDNIATLYCEPKNLQKIKQYLETQNISTTFVELEYIPKTPLAITDPKIKEKIEKFTTALEELEEVNEYYTNARY